MERAPCPKRIYGDLATAFSMGIVGGSIFNFIKGFRNSQKGKRLAVGFRFMRTRGSVFGGNLAMWGGLFSVFDCIILSVRQKEDPWNMLWAGALTGATLQARSGVKAAMRGAIGGFILLGFIELASMAVQRWQMSQQAQMGYMMNGPIPGQPTGYPSEMYDDARKMMFTDAEFEKSDDL